MGVIRAHEPVKLIVGFIFKENLILNRAESILEKQFGRIDFESAELPFDYTDYYRKEMGLGLKRKFISFKKLITPEALPGIKIITNKIEKKMSLSGVRAINIDPGYLNLSKLVLASTKDYFHRIHLNKGIFAEITLFYRGNTFKPWDWTYPDYKTPEYARIFNNIRAIYDGQNKPE